MATTHSTEEQVQALERRIRRAYLAVVSQVRSETTLRELEALVQTGQMQPLVDALTRAAAQLGDAATIGYAQSARAAARIAGVAFDGTNHRAVAEMARQRNRIIRELGREQVSVVRQTMQRGVTAGLNPRVIARDIRASIGLTARQEEAVANFKRMLQSGDREALTRQLRDRRFDRKVLRAVRGERALTSKEVDRMTDRYRARYIAYRAEVIGRTEALEAANGGANEMWRQAAASGGVERDRIVRRWVTSGRTNRRDSHRRMQGQLRGLDEPFVSGNGVTLRFPGDPNAPLSEIAQCACTVTTRILSPREAAERRRSLGLPPLQPAAPPTPVPADVEDAGARLDPRSLAASMRAEDMASTRRQVRDGLRGEFGLHIQSGTSRVADIGDINVVDTPGFGGALGATGRMTIERSVFRGANRFFDSAASGDDVSAFTLRDASTLIHEEIHAFGADAAGAYQGIGAVAEELATELLARRYMRTRFASTRVSRGMLGLETMADAAATSLGVDSPYGHWIDQASDAVASILGVDKSAALALMDDAALRFKRDRRSSTTPRQLADRWMDGLGDLTRSQRSRLRKELAEISATRPTIR